MQGDGTHMWPYGINGAHEDNGSEFLYVANSLITQGLGEDGLPPSGGFATPAYTFKHTDGTKYYLKSEDKNRGRNNSYLVENAVGNIVYKEMSSADALLNDSAAWLVSFNPANCYYQIKNAATGKYVSYKYVGVNGVGAVARTVPTASDNFQLMEARINTEIGSGSSKFISRGYWITRPERKLNPPTLTAAPNGVTSATAFNLTNEAVFQRWLILNEEEVILMDAAQGTSVLKISSSGINVYSLKNRLVIDNISIPSDIMVYNITGSLAAKTATSSISHTFNLSEGIYVVSIVSREYKDVVKVVVK